MNQPETMSAHDAAVRLSLSIDTVLQLARSGALPAHAVDGAYRFRREDVESYARRSADTDPPGDGIVNDLVRRPDADSEQR